MIKVNIVFAFVLLFIPRIVIGNIDTGIEKPVLITERVFLNTDRRIYIAGENLLYSLYLIDNKKNSLANYPSIGYVILRNTNGEVLGKSQVKIKDGKAAGAIYLSDTLHSGYYQIVAYTNFMRNGSPDIFFKTQVMVANRFDNDFFGLITPQGADSTVVGEGSLGNKNATPISIIPQKHTYHKREKAGFKIKIQQDGIKYSDLTVSVVEKNKVEEQYASNVNKSAWVSKGVFFDASTDREYPLHLAENKYAVLLGRLTDAERNDPIANHVLYLSSPDTVTSFEYAVTDARGYFRFPLTDFYSGKDLFIKLKTNEGETIIPNITIDSKSDINETFSPKMWPMDSSVISYLKNSQALVRVQKSFSLIQSQHQPYKLFSEAPLLFRVADYSVVPADYVELRDFIEISREIIPALKIRKHNQDYLAEVLDIQQRHYLGDPPLIFLDGVIIDNINQVIPYGTKEIRKIDIISTPWIIDHQKLAGVVSIHSHNKIWKNISLSDNNLRIKADNYYQLPNLYFPNYSIIESRREPDFRQLLFWNPNYHLDSDNSGLVEFYTSDYASSYIIRVSGVSDKGEKIEAYSEFEVIE